MRTWAAALASCGVVAAALAGCGKEPANQPSTTGAKPPAAAAAKADGVKPTLAALVAAVDQTDTAASLRALGTLLRAGASHDDLRTAILVAHGRLAAPPLETELQAALWRVERAMPPGRRLEALLHMAARHRQALRRYGHAATAAAAPVALRSLDKDGLQERVDLALRAGDRAMVSATLRVTIEEDGQEQLSDALIRVACADDGAGGQASIGVVAGLRLLEASVYAQPSALVDRLGQMPPGGAASQPERLGALRMLARSLPGRFADGAAAPISPAATASLRAAAARLAGRGANAGDNLVEAVRVALSEGAPAGSLWDGLLLGAADLHARGETEGLSLRLVHALRMGGERAPSSTVRALAIFSAAQRLGDAWGRVQVPMGAVPTPGAATTTVAAVEVQPEPDLGAVRLRLIERDLPAARVALAVAQVEAGSMVAADWRPDVWEPLGALLAAKAEDWPEAPDRQANLTLIAELRAKPVDAPKP